MKLTPTQQKVYDALAGGLKLRYFAPKFISSGFFVIDSPPLAQRVSVRAPHTTIPALAKKGALQCVRRFASDATESERMGNLSGYEYVRVEGF